MEDSLVGGVVTMLTAADRDKLNVAELKLESGWDDLEKKGLKTVFKECYTEGPCVWHTCLFGCAVSSQIAGWIYVWCFRAILLNKVIPEPVNPDFFSAPTVPTKEIGKVLIKK